MKIVRSNRVPLTEQIVRNISMEIDKGVYGIGFQLLSINNFSDQHVVARDTVERAYKELKRQGYITSSRGRGYFVSSRKEEKLKVLFIFNKINSYKNDIYYSFLETLNGHAKVDIQIHHNDPECFKEIIENSLGKFHYYVVIPHFSVESDPSKYLSVIKKIPSNQLMLLDKNLPGFNNHMSVYQDFQQDVFDALSSGKASLKLYKNISFVSSEPTRHPPTILDGIREFCTCYEMPLKILYDLKEVKLTKQTTYILTSDDDLALLIKKARVSTFIPGKDIGIISFNDTVFKELMDITVLTTDYGQMGRTAAELISSSRYCQIRNPFKMIKRSSL